MSQQPAARPRVFLCHSSGDISAVRSLYERLKADGFQPWLAEEDLLGGQAWQTAIPRAVKASDVVIVCLSSEAASKRGFFQKEIKLALDTADELPDGAIFAIPLKLEECDIPDRLSHLQWVDYYQADGYQRLVRSLPTPSTPTPSEPPQAPAVAIPPPDSTGSPSFGAKPTPTAADKLFPNWARIAALALSAALVIVSLYLNREPQSSKTQGPAAESASRQIPAPAPTAQTLKRSPLTFQEFIEYLADDTHTSLQRAEFVQSHLGSRVTWTGWVGSVSDNRQAGISMLLAPELGSDSRFLAFLLFPQADRSALLFLGFRQKVTVDCTLADFDSNAQLEECKLVEVWPGEKSPTQAAKLSPITYQEFVKFFVEEPHTQIQQDNFRKSLLRSRVTWTGWVGNVSAAEHENEISVVLAPDRDFLIRADLYFPSGNRSTLISLNFGQKITVDCILSEPRIRAQLKECRLVKVWPKSSSGS